MERSRGHKLLIVGAPFHAKIEKSPYLRHLQGKVSDLGDLVSFTGYVPYSQLPYYFGAADLTVVPSLWNEPFGKVVIESMSCEVPVVASARGGIPEIIGDGVTGRLVRNPESAEHLADAIAETLSRPQDAAAMSRAAGAKVMETFATATRIARTRSFYQSNMGRWSGQPVNSSSFREQISVPT